MSSGQFECGFCTVSPSSTRNTYKLKSRYPTDDLLLFEMNANKYATPDFAAAVHKNLFYTRVNTFIDRIQTDFCDFPI